MKLERTKGERATGRLFSSFRFRYSLRHPIFNIRHLILFVIRDESFQPAFVEFDQIKISPNIFAAFATCLLEKM